MYDELYDRHKKKIIIAVVLLGITFVSRVSYHIVKLSIDFGERM